MSHKLGQRIAVALLMIAPLAVGTTLASMGCMETALMAVNPCGTVFSNCTPDDWYRWIVWPTVTYPDYDRDPSCTIPYACGDWFGNAADMGATGEGTTTTTQ